MEYSSVLERQDRRTLSISIGRDGVVKIKAPYSMPMHEIKKFVSDKQKWIIDKLRSINNMIENNKDLIEYNQFMFLGTKYKPYYADVSGIVLDTEAHSIFVPKSTAESAVVVSIAGFFKKKAKEILSQRVKSISDTMNVAPKRIRFTSTKSRWGSCSAASIVSFNWRLIMLPTKIIDYVIVHELSHIKHMDHSNRFWSEVSVYIPDYGILRKDLKRYSFVLNLMI